MNTTNYYSMGIDAHKQFCQIHVLHPDGDIVWKGRINRTEYHRFAEVVKPLDGPCKAVFESSTNGHVPYDLLCATEGVCEVMTDAGAAARWHGWKRVPPTTAARWMRRPCKRCVAVGIWVRKVSKTSCWG